ncbi:unnamed protein product [Ixodes pacificus]
MNLRNSEQEKQVAELSELIDELTSPGSEQSKEKKLKRLKKLCRTSDDLLKHTYHLIMKALEEDDSETRLDAVRLTDELFKRSHLFRTLLLEHFEKFMELVAETNLDLPLPGSEAAARNLKEKSLAVIDEWHEKFGANYKLLSLAVNFLKNRKQAQRRTEEQPAWAQRMLNEISDRTPDVQLVITQMENCFRLLVPHEIAGGNPEPPPEPEPETSQAERLRGHAVSATFTLEIQVPQVVRMNETTDNADLLDNLRRLHHELMTVFFPLVKKWLKGLAKISHPPDILRNTIDLKCSIEAAHEKFGELHVEPEASSDDSDLEEVPDKEGYEPIIPVNKRAEYGLEPIESGPPKKTPQKKIPETEASDPTSREAQLRRLAEMLASQNDSEICGVPSKYHPARTAPSAKDLMEAGPSTSSAVPTLPFDTDLLYWGQEKVEAPTPARVLDLNCVWKGADRDEDSLQQQVVPFRERRIDFSGEFVPVKWTCRARLPSGKLCPRRDRHKCPLHGPIVARDELGNPQDPSTAKASAVPDWQEPGLLRDLEAATGAQLHVGRRQRRILPRRQGNPRARLEKKIFNKRSVRKVAESMNAIDGKKFNDKFGDQWNYAFGT